MNPYEIIHISFDLKELLQEIYYIQTRSGTQKADITVEEIHGHNKSLLPYLKPEKAAKILSQLLEVLSINQPQIPTNIPIRRPVGRAGFRRKVPGTNPLLKPKVFCNHLRSKGQHCLLNIFKFLKIVSSLNHIPKLQSRSEVNSREVTKQIILLTSANISNLTFPYTTNFPEIDV